jgi:hypothetical protein
MSTHRDLVRDSTDLNSGIGREFEIVDPSQLSKPIGSSLLEHLDVRAMVMGKSQGDTGLDGIDQGVFAVDDDGNIL